MSRQPCRPERGSAALEAAVGLPAFMLFVALIVLAGRVAIATQAVDSAAAASARTASIARTAGDANASARSAAAKGACRYCALGAGPPRLVQCVASQREVGRSGQSLQRPRRHARQQCHQRSGKLLGVVLRRPGLLDA